MRTSYLLLSLHSLKEDNVRGLEPPLVFLGKGKLQYGAGPGAQWLSSCTLLQWPGDHRFESWVQTYRPLIKPGCGDIPHIKQRKTATDVSSAAIFLKQKEEDWHQILAQGQSSSHTHKKNTQKHKSKMQIISFILLGRLYSSLRKIKKKLKYFVVFCCGEQSLGPTGRKKRKIRFGLSLRKIYQVKMFNENEMDAF